MKILMLGWELPPHNSGGLGVACLNMARALARQGVAIDFVVPYAAKHPEIDFMRVLAATRLDPIYRYGGGAYENLRLLEKIIPDENATRKISLREVQHQYCQFVDQYLAQQFGVSPAVPDAPTAPDSLAASKNSIRSKSPSTTPPEIVHAHDWLTYEAGILAKKRYRLPLIAHVHATEWDRAGMRPGNPLIHEIEYEGLLLADRIIAVSEATKRIVHDKYGIPMSRIEVVYNSLDDDYCRGDYHFDTNAYAYLEGMKQKGYTIISAVGRFTVQKGLWHFLHAAALAVRHNPKLLFLLAGDGEEKNELVSLAAELGISQNVLFTGFVRGQKLRDVYAVSDVFVMSSISEPFGLTALEAAHHGDALILTKQSGVSEVIWSAMKYDFWDEHKLADEILAIAEHPALKSSLQNNVAREYHQISWDTVAKKCLRVYNRTMKHKRF